MRFYALMDRLNSRIVFETVLALDNDAVLQRTLKDTVRGESSFARHPEDYMVLELGVFSNGQFESGLPREVGPLSDLIASLPQAL